jgi:hypothetical protein
MQCSQGLEHVFERAVPVDKRSVWTGGSIYNTYHISQIPNWTVKGPGTERNRALEGIVR